MRLKIIGFDFVVLIILVLSKALKVQKVLKAPKAFRATQAHKALRGQKAIPALPARAPTPPLKLVVTRAHRPIFTLTLPQCRGLRRRLRRFKEVES